MPKVIVYVPVAAWRKLEARGLDPAQAVRDFARRGYELTEPGLMEREEASPTDPGGTGSLETSRSVNADALPRDIPARTVSPEDHFRPDPK